MQNKIQRILVIRFRQVGDSVLSIALCSTLKRSFPKAEIHFVLNKNIAQLYETHPDIDKIITFDKDENNGFRYIKKVWNIVHQNKYDVIIDMRSTPKTLLFSLFSPHTKFNIGCKKKYTIFILKYRIDIENANLNIDRVQQNLMFAKPLEKIAPINYISSFKLYIQHSEIEKFRKYMQEQGVDFSRPVILAAVTAKIKYKEWNLERMKTIIELILENFDVQVIFNYVAGHEEDDAKSMYNELNKNKNIFINVEANSLRQLAAMCANCDFYFGNEGGTRHIMQSLDKPSFSIFSPKVNKQTWLPKNNIEAIGISVNDFYTEEKIKNLTYQQKYDLITIDKVWGRLNGVLQKHFKSHS